LAAEEHDTQVRKTGCRLTAQDWVSFDTRRRREPAPEETELLAIEPRVAGYLKRLKQQIGNRRAPLRRLLAMLKEYPREAFLAALASAEQHGLFALERLEKMVLKRIAKDYFVLPPELSKDEPSDE
jgi:hypothetical protein